MNSKILFFLFVLFLISACGVKGDPLVPKEPAFPSLMNNYPDIETDKKLDETRKR
ncbi:MAG: lipoprotein [Bacteriovoracaceae bacterium]